MAIRHTTQATAGGSNPAFSGAGLAAWNEDHTGYDLLANDAPNQDFDLSGGGAVTVLSKSIPTIVGKDSIWVEYWATILNNSGGARAYTSSRNLGAFTTSFASGALTNSATSRIIWHERAQWAVSATNLAYLVTETHVTSPLATSTGAVVGVTGFPGVTWNTSASNFTGTQTMTIVFTSGGAVATQTFTLHSYKIWRVASSP